MIQFDHIPSITIRLDTCSLSSLFIPSTTNPEHSSPIAIFHSPRFLILFFLSPVKFAQLCLPIHFSRCFPHTQRMRTIAIHPQPLLTITIRHHSPDLQRVEIQSLGVSLV